MKFQKTSTALLSAAIVSMSAGSALAGDTIEKVDHLDTQKFRVTVENVAYNIDETEAAEWIEALDAYIPDFSNELEIEITPGVWATHLDTIHNFNTLLPENGMGLHGLSHMEDRVKGTEMLEQRIAQLPGVRQADNFLNPNFNPFPAKADAGNAYSFDIEASPGEKLSFATAIADTNLLLAPIDNGIDLFVNGYPIEGDVSHMMQVWHSNSAADAVSPISVAYVPGTGSMENYPIAPNFVKVTVEPIQ